MNYFWISLSSINKFFLFSIFFIGSVYAEVDDFKISGLLVEGNRRIDSAAIVAQIQHATGVVTRSQVDQSIKALYKTGFFEQITTSIVNNAKGQVLKYLVVEKPVVRKIFIQGNKEIKESELRDVIKLGSDRFLDKTRVDALIKNANIYYQSQGYYDANFSSSIVPVADNQVDLTISVTEGDKIRLRRINFTGLSEVDEDDLKSAMQTKRYKWWNSWLFGTGRLIPEMLENDRGLLRQYFLDNGYIDAVISEAKIDRTENGLEVSFDIQEGRQYKITSISASGDLIENSIQQTIDDIDSEEQEVFSASKVREDSLKISEKFTDLGYAFANVVPETNIDRTNSTVAINFVGSKGQAVTVNRISIHGNNKTYDNVIRREMRIDEQDQYSGSKIKRSQQRLERLGFFEEVNITSEPNVDQSQVDLNVNVREASTGTFSAGAGFSSSDGALFNARLTENNIFGTGRSLTLNADLGTRRDNLVLSLNDNRINDTFVSGGIDILRSDRVYSDFDRRLTGAAIELGYPLEQIFGEWAENWSSSLQYQYLQIRISDIDFEDAAPLVIRSEGTSTSSAITPKLTRNTINNPLNPSKGSRQIFSAEFSGLGGEEEYYLFEARNQWYQPLFKTGFGDFVFSWRTSIGYGDSYGEEPFPLFKRYFPGGINSVRGFKNRTLGPKDEKGNEYGGSKELVNNWELIFPLINSAGLKGVVFYDIGQAFDDDQNIKTSELRKAYGYGIRWNSPLGPIRVEFGFPIDKEDDESSMVTLFSFGSPL